MAVIQINDYSKTRARLSQINWVARGDFKVPSFTYIVYSLSKITINSISPITRVNEVVPLVHIDQSHKLIKSILLIDCEVKGMKSKMEKYIK